MPLESIQPVNNYNLKANIVTLGGIRIEGAAEDGFLTYEFGSDLIETTVGADGCVSVSMINDDSAIAVITVKETVPAAKILWDLSRAQRAAMQITRIPPLPFYHADLITGDLASDPQAVFVSVPGMNKGSTLGTREFRILLPYVRRTMVQAAKNIF